MDRFSVTLSETQRAYMEGALQRAARLVAISERRPLKPEEREQLFRHMQTARMSCNAAGLVDKRTDGSPKLDELRG